MIDNDKFTFRIDFRNIPAEEDGFITFETNPDESITILAGENYALTSMPPKRAIIADLKSPAPYSYKTSEENSR